MGYGGAMSRKLIFAAVTICLSIFVSVLCLEAGLRLFGFQPRAPLSAASTIDEGFSYSWGKLHPVYGWVNRPGTYATTYAPMTFDAAGRRQTGYSGTNENGEIIVVGGSITQGYQVDDEVAYASVLDAIYPTLKVRNYASGGWGTYQSYLRTRDALKADPQNRTRWVIYGLYSDHRRRNIASWEWINALRDSRGRNISPPHVRRYFTNDLAEHGLEVVEPWPMESKSSLVTLMHLGVRVILNPPRRSTHMYEVMRDILKRMDHVVQMHDANLLVVFLDYPEPLLQGWLTDSGIAWVNCENPDWHDPKYLVGGTGYPNAKLHNEWADCIADALSQRGLEPHASAR